MLGPYHPSLQYQCSQILGKYTKELDKILVSEDLDAAAISHSAVEEFARRLPVSLAGVAHWQDRATGRLQI